MRPNSSNFANPIFWSAVSLFVLFLAYFVFTARLLPLWSGPDEEANRAAAHFIYQNHRLAVFPEDESSVQFSEYHGTTRSTRPPFSFIVAALLATAVTDDDDDLSITLRYGSALLSSLTVVITLLAITIYTRNLFLGWFGALSIGLLPQFSFIASYCNDDSGAIFASSLTVLGIVSIYRYGINVITVALIGIAIGVILQSKYTAWLILPFVTIFLVVVSSRDFSRAITFLPLFLFLTVLGGGWWILFNVYQYGLDDPLQRNIAREMVPKYGDLNWINGLPYAVTGVSFKDVLFGNYQEFWNQTLIATIGHLDWLRLRMGNLQYGFYSLFGVFAITTMLLRLIHLPFLIKSQGRFVTGHTKKTAFELLLFLGIIFQAYMYVWHYYYIDAQLQGKYLLPSFLPLLLLALSGLNSILKSPYVVRFREWIATSGQLSVGKIGSIAILGFVLFVHWNGLVSYVRPFYRPEAYFVNLKSFAPVNLDSLSIVAETTDLGLTLKNGGWYIRSTGTKPNIIFTPELCRSFFRNTVIRIRLQADHADEARLVVVTGSDPDNKQSDRAKYSTGESVITFAIGSDQCRGVRFEPMRNEGALFIEEIAIAELGINATNLPL